VKNGYKANGKDWKVHLDGHDFVPYFKGEVKKSPRDTIYYFGQGGELNAVRWNDWKVHFAIIEGNIATGERVVTNWPLIIHLRADPYEEMHEEGEMGYLRWFGDNMWLFVPIQAKLKEFFVTIPQFPFQEGSSLSAGNINYNSLKAMKALKMLEEIGERFPVGQ
jgi:arylsulfatase